jgi:ubiquinone/menaquinone biosynthesis C-methylase UbiE
MMQERVGNTPEEYAAVKERYQGDVAATYEDRRFRGPLGRLKNWRDQQLVWRAVQHAGNVQRVLDVPCGTGRCLRSLAPRIPCLVGGDLSRDMMDLSRRHHGDLGPPRGLLEYVQCDAERLPYCDAGFDLVLTGRFMHHLPPDVRVQVLREFARVSAGWVVIDFNMQYGLKYHLRRARSFLKGRPSDRQRMSPAQVFAELAEAGLRVERIYPVSWLLSEKWYVLCRKS